MNIRQMIVIGLWSSATSLLPKGMREKHSVRAKWRLCKKANSCFVHVPKVAGTAISHAIYGRKLGHWPAATIRRWVGEKEFESIPSFSVLRDPYERVASAFRYLQGGGTRTGGVHPRSFFWARKYPTLEDFVLKGLVGEDLFGRDYSVWPQTAFICGSNEREVLVDRVYLLEHLQEDWPEISGWLNLSGELPRLNETLSTGARLKVETPAPRIVEALKKIYSSDYRLIESLRDGRGDNPRGGLCS